MMMMSNPQSLNVDETHCQGQTLRLTASQARNNRLTAKEQRTKP